MLRKFLFVLVSLLAAGNLACSTTENANASNAGVKPANQIDSANMPPEFSANAVQMSANATPGIPNPNDANANKVLTGNIPGIPDANKIGKTPQPKNTPPILGIPDQETIKKQMNTPLKDVNVVNNPPPSQPGGNVRPPEKRGNRPPQ